MLTKPASTLKLPNYLDKTVNLTTINNYLVSSLTAKVKTFIHSVCSHLFYVKMNNLTSTKRHLHKDIKSSLFWGLGPNIVHFSFCNAFYHEIE